MVVNVISNKNFKDELNNETQELEENEVIKTSPCGRWEKRKQKFSLREFPCLPEAYLAMDTEEGVEVVWTEIFMDSNSFSQMDRIKALLDMVTDFEHPNLVKFHDYWIEDCENNKIIIFITECLTCGSLSEFFKKSRSNHKNMPLNTWKRWCRQILLGIQYLHNKIPPFFISNLDCNNIFIKHNGLIKIGLVHSLTTISTDYKTSKIQDSLTRESRIYSHHPFITEKSASHIFKDILSFGYITLEMATLGEKHYESSQITSLNQSSSMLSEVKKKLEEIAKINIDQAKFIKECLKSRSGWYPSPEYLLTHRILFDIPKLMLIACHKCIDINETKINGSEIELMTATLQKVNKNTSEVVTKKFISKDFNSIVNLEQFLKEVSIGMHPITCLQKSTEYDNTIIRDNAVTDSNNESFVSPEFCAESWHEKESKPEEYGSSILIPRQSEIQTKSFEFNFKLPILTNDIFHNHKITQQINIPIVCVDCYVIGDYRNYISQKKIKKIPFNHSLHLTFLFENNKKLKLSCGFSVEEDSPSSLVNELIKNNFITEEYFSFMENVIEMGYKTKRPIRCFYSIN